MIAVQHAAFPTNSAVAAKARRSVRTVLPRVRASSTESAPNYAAPPSVTRAPSQGLKLKVLNSISACVEVNAQVLTFETFAGRAAMIGFIVAMFSETITAQGVFQGVGEQQLATILASALACVVAAGVLATTTRRKFGYRLREAVITSLTAVRRSSASVSQRQVDGAVDYVFDTSLDMKTLHATIDEEYL